MCDATMKTSRRGEDSHNGIIFSSSSSLYIYIYGVIYGENNNENTNLRILIKISKSAITRLAACIKCS